MKNLIIILLVIMFTNCTGKQVGKICQQASATVVNSCKSISLGTAAVVDQVKEVSNTGNNNDRSSYKLSPMNMYETIRLW